MIRGPIRDTAAEAYHYLEAADLVLQELYMALEDTEARSEVLQAMRLLKSSRSHMEGFERVFEEQERKAGEHDEEEQT